MFASRSPKTLAVTGAFSAGGFRFACWRSRALGSAFRRLALGARFSSMFAPSSSASRGGFDPVDPVGGAVAAWAPPRVCCLRSEHRTTAIDFSLAAGLLLTVAALTAGGGGATGLGRRRDPASEHEARRDTCEARCFRNVIFLRCGLGDERRGRVCRDISSLRAQARSSDGRPRRTSC